MALWVDSGGQSAAYGLTRPQDTLTLEIVRCPASSLCGKPSGEKSSSDWKPVPPP